jgi:mono/diheme cytochrome c family protein
MPLHGRAVLVLSTLVVLACADGVPSVEVERAVVTLPGGGAPALLFLTVRNTGVLPLFLKELEVEGAGTVTIRTETPHRMPMGQASFEPMATMSAVDSILIPSGRELRLVPGGYTGVVESVVRPLSAGESRTVTLRFSRARDVTLRARVAAYADLDALLAPAGSSATGLDTAPPSAAEGRDLYASDGCAACHGLLGVGDGPVGRTLDPPPRDFRDATAFKNGVDAAAIAQTLATGIPGGGSMPLYAHLTERERRSLALYVISLRSPSPPTSGSTP